MQVKRAHALVAAAAFAVAAAAAAFLALRDPSRPAAPPDDNAAAPAAVEPIPSASPSRELAAPRNDVPGASNLAQISPGLFRSAQPTREGFERLAKMGVRTVVNLRAFHSDRELLTGLGMGYVHIPFEPWSPKQEHVVRFLQVVGDPRNRPVLVHCQHGADRTGTMVALYRVHEQGWRMNEAMQELPRFGFHSIWGNLRTFLERTDVEAVRAQVGRVTPPVVEQVR
jgi:protein tyrosine phosphatase (PTP) superfamily phosphohydrolase (DUF442 family)